MFGRLISLVVGWSLALSVIVSGHGASAATAADAAELCQEGGFVQFTPDGDRPFADAAECMAFAAQQGGANGLIRRVGVSLTDEGRGASIFADFAVTGLVPDRPYLAAIGLSPYDRGISPIVFISDSVGTYAGLVATTAPADCTGGTRIFVRITTLDGFLLGTNGTFLPC
jgi:hypothetical protein